MARAHSHNTVAFYECPMVTPGSRLYISHLSECKVRVAIFIEQNQSGNVGFGPSVCTAAPEILSAQNKNETGNQKNVDIVVGKGKHLFSESGHINQGSP